jgi:hypothetical protein
MLMVNVSTYNVYVQMDGTTPVLIGDVGPDNTISVNQAGPAIIGITTGQGIAFADPALIWVTAPGEAPPAFVAWGPINPDPLGRTDCEIVISDANGGAGTVNFQLNLAGVAAPLAGSLANAIG